MKKYPVYIKLTCGICGREMTNNFEFSDEADEWWNKMAKIKNFVCCNSYMLKTIHKDEKDETQIKNGN
jgi:hypothetical protein